jgi:hypothetical protein
MAERRPAGRRAGGTCGFIAALAVLVLIAEGPAHGLSPAERTQILKSLKPAEVSRVEAATGGLDNLPLLKVDIALDIPARRISGTARVDWRNGTGQTVSVLPIRLAANGDKEDGPLLTYTHLRVAVGNSESVPVDARKVSTSLLQVTLPHPVAPGDRVVIDGKLDGRMALLSEGATDPVQASMGAVLGAKSKATGDQYGTFACGDDICSMTLFAPEVPAFVDGAFDTAEGSGIGDWPYADPANLILDVVANLEVKLAATGIETASVSAPHLQQHTTFAMAATREVGLVAAEGFVSQTQTVDGVRVRSWSVTADKSGGKRALKAATQSIRTFDEVLGPYPWSFLNVCESALVGGAGGDELPGLTLNGSAFYRPASGLLSMLGGGGGDGLFGTMLDFITRHEVAHEWWFAQVGSHPQLHPYIDEPLAQWSALYSVRVNQGAEAAEAAKTTQIAMNFQALPMMGFQDGKAARPAGQFASPVEYAGIVYGKAPLFFEAAAKEFGEGRILAALRTFVEQRRFKRAVPGDERAALEGAVGSANVPAMRALWRHWFEEEHGHEDLGDLNMGALTSQMGLPQDALGGLGGASTLDPAAIKDAMKQLQEFMGTGGLGLGGGGGISDKDAQELLKQLGGGSNMTPEQAEKEARKLMKEFGIDEKALQGGGKPPSDDDE